MAENLGKWPSGREPISKIRPSDGCGRDAVPLAVGRWYEFHGFGCHLENVGFIPHSPVALHEVAHLFGALVAETILASVHVRAHKQAGHMDASDLIKALQNTLQGGGRPHMGNAG